MKKIIAGSLIALSIITNIQAADSEVKAEIVKHCIRTNLKASVVFQNIDPLTQHNQVVGAVENNTNHDGHMYIDAKCTKNTSLKTDFTSSNGWKLKNGFKEISYNIKKKWDSTENGDKTIFTAGNGHTDQIANRSLFFTIDKSMEPGTYTDVITTTFTW